MTEEIRSQAAAATKDVDAVAQVPLPEPKADLIVVDTASAADKAKIEEAMAQLDMDNTQSIIGFGSSAQAELQQISQAMLADVKSKDVGPAGDALRDMVTSLRGFSAEELDPNRKLSWWERLLGKAQPMAEFMSRYEDVQGQIDKITGDLLQHEHILLKDIKSLDKLYEKTLDFYDQLAIYIAAGEEKLRILDAADIPALEREVNEAPEDQGVIKAQELRDLRSARDDLERRVHDLKLTRQVTMQSLPSIRLVQENDKSLVTKINSTLVNTVPLWETQLAQAVTIHRSREAAGVVKDANDLTNELLTSNASNLKTANAEIRTQMERGVFDIEAIKQANSDLIATIEESLAIADEGKAKRAEAERELIAMETELKNTLAAAKAKETGLGVNVGESVDPA
ncbi:toxic anion resistance protein [Oceanomicrobium pacificus]|uniref:Toxic anion resistance protein n=1 Tax=Oceanomicrobium pacificus TaxID=2692916 RepID=A0A6B0TWM2_9RHOB|nr:toxic anion resistance protein [Oceanomicrobium pacificus]MXU65403.1 toxic anion resistance protein [Oceanomicrobium pacificus]